MTSEPMGSSANSKLSNEWFLRYLALADALKTKLIVAGPITQEPLIMSLRVGR